MKKIAIVFCLGATFVATGCGSNHAQESTGALTSSLIQPGNKLRGSDTLKDAVTAAITASGIPEIVYEGTGSGNGAKCLIGSAGDAVCPTAQQTIAPMSRAFTAAECTNPSVTLASHVIALDGVVVLAKGDQVTGADAQITIAQLRSIFAGGSPETSKGDATDCANPSRITTWAQLNPNALDPGSIVTYRRDDASGTTDTFKTLVGIKAFCSDVTVVTPTGAESATDQIRRFTSTQQTAMAFAGDSAKSADGSNTTLAVALTGQGPFVAPSAASIRLLQTDPANAYPLARRLFLNEATGGAGAATREPSEAAFLDYALGRGADPTTLKSFTDILVANGFIGCSDDTSVACVNFDSCRP